ncbi:MAG: hypothetical protein ACT4PL_01115 [Phycisphaerales bacterium]
MADARITPAPDEFYIGYVPRTPRGIATRMRAAIILLMVAGATVAAVCAIAQHAPAPSAWPSDSVALRGYVILDPYPRLVVPADDPAAPPRTVLLSAVGKFGLIAAENCGPPNSTLPPVGPEQAEQRAALREVAMHYVELRGSIIRREGRELLEVTSSGLEMRRSRDDLRGSDQSRLGFTIPPIEDLGEVTLDGEIADPKCFLGAMKPGSGLTHKACAVRCLSGGITPVLVVRDATEAWAMMTLTDDQGRACLAGLTPLAGEPVRLVGRLTRRADALFLAVREVRPL